MNWDEQINLKLARLRRQLTWQTMLSGMWRLCAFIMIVLLAAALFETVFHSSPVVRTWLFTGVIFFIVIFATLWLIRPLLRHLINPADHESLALRWGYSLPGISDRLLNALQVYEHREQANTSPDLAVHALTVIGEELKDAGIEPAIDLMPARRARSWALRSVAVCALAFIIGQAALLQGFSRVFQPGRDFRPPPPFALQIGETPEFIIKGEPFDIEIRGEGDLPDEFTLNILEANSEPRAEKLTFDSSLTAQYTFIDPQQDFLLFAAADQVFSDTAEVTVRSRPFIKELQVRWFPPAYSKLPSGSAIGKRGDVAALKGSRVRVSFVADRDLESGSLTIFSDDNPYQPRRINLTLQGNEAHAEFALLKNGHYNIKFEDRDGIHSAEPVDYNLWPILDEWPVISIFYPPSEAEFNESLLVPLKAGGRDDFAISRFRLGRKLVKAGREDSSATDDFIWQDIPFEMYEDGTALVDQLLDFNDLSLLPGDHVLYRLQAFDNDAVSGPKKAETPVYRLIFPTLEEIFARMEESYDAQYDDIEETLDRSYELREELQALQEELKRNPELSWEEQKNIEDMIKRQEEMAKDAQEMAERIDEMIQKMEENNLLTPETMEKYMELQQMMSEVMSPELMEAMRKLQEAIKQQDPEQLRRAVEDFSMNQEEFMEKMEKTLNILKQLQAEMKMDELAKRAEQLLEKQQEINQALTDSSSGQSSQELAQAEERLQNEMEAFEQAFQDAQEMLQDSPYSPTELMEQAKELMDQEQFPQSMSQMSEQLQQSQKSKGQKSGEKIEGGLSQLTDLMKQAKEQMVNEAKSELAEKLRKISHDLLNLSFQQEDLLDRSTDLDKASPQFRSLAQEQQTLKNHLEKSAQELFGLAQESFFITPQIGAAMDQAFRGMEQALDGYTARSPRSVSRQQRSSMGGLNQAVMQIGESLDQLSSSSSSTGFSEMMEQLAQMAGQQSQINQGTMTLLPGGQNPGQMSMEQQAALSRLASEQQALQQQMEQWNEANQQVSKAMGRMGELAKEMQEVVDDLKNRQVDQRTLQRQERILRRLLDAQKSVREREYRRERLSRTAEGPYYRPSPDELELTITPDEARENLLRALREGYTRDYQQLIRNYFDALGRENSQN